MCIRDRGINSCLVLEGVPLASRSGQFPAFAYAKVLEVHDGASVSIPEGVSKCKIESA